MMELPPAPASDVDALPRSASVVTREFMLEEGCDPADTPAIVIEVTREDFVKVRVACATLALAAELLHDLRAVPVAFYVGRDEDWTALVATLRALDGASVH